MQAMPPLLAALRAVLAPEQHRGEIATAGWALKVNSHRSLLLKEKFFCHGRNYRAALRLVLKSSTVVPLRRVAKAWG